MNKEDIEKEINKCIFQIKEFEDVILILEGNPEIYEPKIAEIQEKIQVLKQELAKL